LKTLPWEKVEIDALLIEVDHIGEIFDGTRKDLEDFLSSKGFQLIRDIGGDALYAKEQLLIKAKK